MRTLQPVLKRGLNSWDKINMPVSEFEGRVARIRALMGEEHIDILLLYSNDLDNYGVQSYISNFSMETIGGTIVAIPADGKVALIFEGGPRLIPLVKTMTWIDELKTGSNVSEVCVKYLAANKLIPSTIGLVGLNHLMPYEEWNLFRESTGQCRLVNSEHLMQKTRMVKSAREVDQLRRSARIANNIFNTLVNYRYPEVNECIIEAEAERRAYLDGAADFRMLLTRQSKNKGTFRPPEDKVIPEAEIVTIYIAVEFEGYWVECIRTFVTQSHQLILADVTNTEELLLHHLSADLQTAKTVSQFYKDTIAWLIKSGAGYVPEIGLGNGIGLSLEEFPLIDEKETVLLEPGTCLAVRIGCKHNNDIETTIGHTVCLSETGPEILV